MASNQSWKLEDLGLNDELQQDIGLAEELQSGLYLSEFGSDSMKDIIQSLMDENNAQEPFYNTTDTTTGEREEGAGGGEYFNYTFSPFLPTTPTTPTSDNTGIDCFLRAPTACTAKGEEMSVTYLNRGQPYSMTFNCSPSLVQRCQGTLLKSTLALEFHDLRLRNSVDAQIQEWISYHGGQRMIDIDMTCSGGISRVQYHDDVINSVTFMWNPQIQETIVSFKVHSLSSEFTAKKHGGERGVPFRLVLKTYLLSNTSRNIEEVLYSNCACLVKVFKDKGADRKHKQDVQKRDKMQPDEAIKYWESTPMTKLTQLPLEVDHSDQKQSLSYTSSPVTPTTHQSPLTNNSQTSYTSQLDEVSGRREGRGGEGGEATMYSPSSCEVPNSGSFINNLGPYSSVDETRQWLTENRFNSYASLFVNYGGTDLLRLSRKDVMDLCGPADGIRLYNALHTRTVKRIYVCLEEDTAYHAIFLESLTVNELRQGIARRLSISPLLITALHLQQHTYGILINIDDLCVINMYDEQCFQLQVVKDESGSMQIILKAPSITDVSIPGLQSRS